MTLSLIISQRSIVIAMVYATVAIASSRPVSPNGDPPAAQLPALEDHALLPSGLTDEGQSQRDVGVKGEIPVLSYVNKHPPPQTPTSGTESAANEPRPVRSAPIAELAPCTSTTVVPYKKVDGPTQIDEEVKENSNNSNGSSLAPTQCRPTPPADVIELVQSSNYDSGFGIVAMAFSDIAEKYKLEVYGATESDEAIGSTVCSEIVTLLRVVVPNNKTSSCPYQYQCNFDDQRYPKYLIEMTCTQSQCSSNCSQLSECRPKHFSLIVATLKDKENCSTGLHDASQWDVTGHHINVGCSCA